MDKFIKAIFFFIIVFLFTLGVTLFGITCVPYESVKAKIDVFAPDGKADFFTVERFKQIRIIGITVFLAAGLLSIGRKQSIRYFSRILTSLFSFSREVTQNFSLTSLFSFSREFPRYFSLTSLFSFLREVVQNFKEAVRKEDKIHLYALFLIILIAIAVRLFFISKQIRPDEAFSFLQFAIKPLYIGLTRYSTTNNHLFHTFLVHISYLFFGNQPWAIRLPALFAGILMVPASYIVIRIFYNKHAALLTAGIVASSSMLIYYSTNARGYTLICLIFLLIFALGAYLKQNRNPGAWFLFSLLSAIGFYTIPIMLYPFGIVMMWLFLSIIFKDTNINRSHLLKDLFASLIITILMTLVLYTPVFLVSGLKAVIANKYIAPISLYVFVEKLPRSLNLLWNDWHRYDPSVMTSILVIGFLISLIFHKRLSVHRIPIVMAVIVWCIPVLIVQHVIFYERVWVFLLPIYIGLASSGVMYLLKPIVSKISNHKSVIFAILAVVITFCLGVNKVQTISCFKKVGCEALEVKNITFSLKNCLRPGDIVLPFIRRSQTYPFPPDPRFEYYFELYGIPSEYLFPDLDPQLDLVSGNRILVIVRNESAQKIEELIDEKGLSVNNFSVPGLINRNRIWSIYEMKNLKDSEER